MFAFLFPVFVCSGAAVKSLFMLYDAATLLLCINHMGVIL